MNSIFTVIRFTFMNRMRSKSFLVTTIIIAVVLSALINLPRTIDYFSSDEPSKIGIVQSNAGDVAQMLTQSKTGQEETDIQFVLLADSGSSQASEETARAMMASGSIEGYLDLDYSSESDFPKATYKSEKSMPFGIKSTIQNALQNIKTQLAIKDAGLSPDETAKLFTPVKLDSVQISLNDGTVNGGKTESQMQMAYAMVYALLMLLYMGVIGYGNLVATEITAEKSTRVMELLISSVSPLKQMFGKVVAICLLGLSQVIILAGITAINLFIPENRQMLEELNLNIGDLPISLFIYFIIFYILGYFIYATVFAAVGSIVSRTEDVAQAIMPVTLLIVAGFLIAMFGLQNPTAGFVVAMSYVPFFTPLIMFLRVGMSDPALWEIWLSIGILLVSFIVMSWFAAKIYRTGVLMYGKRPSFKELRKAMKSYDV